MRQFRVVDAGELISSCEQVSPKVTAQTKALPVKQGPWGRNERNKTTGLFDHMAASIKWIRLK